MNSFSKKCLKVNDIVCYQHKQYQIKEITNNNITIMRETPLYDVIKFVNKNQLDETIFY